VNCVNQGFTGVQQNGGYARGDDREASSLMAVPDELSSSMPRPCYAPANDLSALRIRARAETWSRCLGSAGWVTLA